MHDTRKTARLSSQLVTKEKRCYMRKKKSKNISDLSSKSYENMLNLLTC